ncbi:hypothetical protein U1Q18_010664, partial [Sarracenia purpurea var. burkii]
MDRNRGSQLNPDSEIFRVKVWATSQLGCRLLRASVGGYSWIAGFSGLRLYLLWIFGAAALSVLETSVMDCILEFSALGCGELSDVCSAADFLWVAGFGGGVAHGSQVQGVPCTEIRAIQ